MLQWQGHVRVDARAARGLMNTAMHLRKACNHPYLFLAGMNPPYVPSDPEEIVRASGKLFILDNILPKLHSAGLQFGCQTMLSQNFLGV